MITWERLGLKVLSKFFYEPNPPEHGWSLKCQVLFWLLPPFTSMYDWVQKFYFRDILFLHRHNHYFLLRNLWACLREKSFFPHEDWDSTQSLLPNLFLCYLTKECIWGAPNCPNTLSSFDLFYFNLKQSPRACDSGSIMSGIRADLF